MFNSTDHLTSSSTLPLVRLRPAVLRDIPGLNRIVEQSLRELGRGYYTPQQVESALKYAVQVDPQMVRDGTLYLIECGGKLVACGGWSKRGALYRGAENGLLNPATQPARARTFYVHPAWTRRGLGRWLMEETLAAARAGGFRQIELLATRMGEPVYARFGFRELEAVTITQPDGEIFPVKRMIKDLVGWQ
ncbi:MAG TPA: GNAT family N-acetyltransferase [Phototrophicaceae bacterium]|nr:GNAT family N-acetyltransferase [Phototrophicaceae bacterium]